MTMTAEDFKAWKAFTDRRDARYAANWDIVHNGQSGSREAYSYLQKNPRVKPGADLTLIPERRVPLKVLNLMVKEFDGGASKLEGYEFKDQLQVDLIFDYWVTYEVEESTFEEFIGFAVRTILDGEKLSLGKLNRHRANYKHDKEAYALPEAVDSVLKKHGFKR